MTINTKKLVETYGAGELLKSTKKELEMLEENLDFLKNQQYHSNITKYETELLKLKKWEINECSTFYNYGSKLYNLGTQERYLKAFASILVNAEGGYNHGEPVAIEAYRNRSEKPEDFKKVEKLLYLTEKGDSLSFRCPFLDFITEDTFKNLKKLEEEGFYPDNVFSLCLAGLTDDKSFLKKCNGLTFKPYMRDQNLWTNLKIASVINFERIKAADRRIFEKGLIYLLTYYNYEDIDKDLLNEILNYDIDFFNRLALKLGNIYAPDFIRAFKFAYTKEDKLLASVKTVPTYYHTNYLVEIAYLYYALGFSEEEIEKIVLEDLNKNLAIGFSKHRVELLYYKAKLVLEGIPNMPRSKFDDLVQLYAFLGFNETIKELAKTKYSAKSVKECMRKTRANLEKEFENFDMGEAMLFRAKCEDENLHENSKKIIFGIKIKKEDEKKIEYLMDLGIPDYKILNNMILLDNAYYLASNGYYITENNFNSILPFYSKEDMDMIIKKGWSLKKDISLNAFNIKEVLRREK